MSVMNTLEGGLERLARKQREALVIEVEDLSPRLRRLRFGGDELLGYPFTPGGKIKIRLESGQTRSYTPARVDPDAGWMDVIFHIHGNGPASDWAERAQIGDVIGILGPAASLPAPQPGVAWALFLGDETAVGAARALIDALPKGTMVLGAIEIDAEDAGAVDALALPLAILPRQGHFGDVLREWLRTTELPTGPGAIWLSGHTDSAFSLRQMLMARGFEKRQVKVKAYWSDRGHTHRKAVEKLQG